MAGKELQVHLLGNFHLVAGGKPVSGLDSPRLQSFLAYLILHRDAPLQRQRLAFTFWPDSSESQARTNTRNTLFKLREAFPEADRCLEISPQTLWWQPEIPVEIDLDLFGAAADRTDVTGAGQDPEAHRQALLAAVEAYPGDLLPGCYEDWIIPLRERLRGRYLRLLEELAESLAVEGDADRALAHAQELIRQDPLQESSYQLLISIYLDQGQKARAVRTYHQCVETLEKELGLDPGPEIIQLYQEALEREAPPPGAARVTEKSARLVGRQRAWDSLLETWQGFESGGRLALILGEAGVGKTYLGEEFTRWAHKGGAAVLRARSYPTDDELAYTPVTALLRDEKIYKKIAGLNPAWLSELARLLPELREDFPGLPDPEKVSESWKRQRLFEAAARALLDGESRLVILLDDLQWCDRDTLDWLRYLLESEMEAKVLVIAGVRTGDLLPDSPLLPFFAGLGGGGRVSEVLLERLDRETTRELASDLWGEPIGEEAAARLYSETEGNPLFVAELVRAGFLSAPEAFSLPPRVQAVIETRLNGLSSGTRELAELSAAVGREFDYRLLLGTGEREEKELLAELDELWSRRLIREEGTESYNFSHDKFREVLYGELSPHRRVYYHKKVAAALEEIHAGALEAAAPQLAYQHHQAGEKDKALDYYLLAGDQAQLVFAQEEALGYYQAAEGIGLQKKDPRAASTYKGLGKTLFKLARYEESASAYQQMVAATHSMGDCPAEAEGWLLIANNYDRLGEFREAISCADRAAEIAKKEDCPKEYATALLMKGQQHYRLGEGDEAEPLLEEALALHRAAGNQPLIGRCLNLLGLIEDVKGNFKSSMEYKQHALEIFSEMDDPQSRWWIGNITLNMALSILLKGDYQEAQDLLLKAKEAMGDLVDRDWKTMWFFNYGACLVSLGKYQEAEEKLGEVLERTQESGWLGRSLTYHFLAESYLGQGQLAAAQEAALDALELAKSTQGQEYLGAAWRVLGKLAAAQQGKIEVDSQVVHAKECFEQSEEHFRKAGAEDERAHTLKAWGAYEKDRGDRQASERLWAEAWEIFSRLEMAAEVERMNVENQQGSSV